MASIMTRQSTSLYFMISCIRSISGKVPPVRFDNRLKLTVPLAWYVTLGDYDYLLITEAPDEKVMAEIALRASQRGRTRFTTFTAIPIEEFAEVTKKL